MIKKIKEILFPEKTTIRGNNKKIEYLINKAIFDPKIEKIKISNIFELEEKHLNKIEKLNVDDIFEINNSKFKIIEKNKKSIVIEPVLDKYKTSYMCR